MNELVIKVDPIYHLAAAVGVRSIMDHPAETLDDEKAYGPGFEDMQRRCPNVEKLKNLIGFKPNRDLEAIIQSVIDYFKE
jgi:UDP-glucose 4-epimerase